MDIPFYEWVYLAACQELERELTAATARAEQAEAEIAHMKANNRYQKGYADGEKSCQSELAEKKRKTISESELNELREGWIKVPAIERDLAEARRQVDALIEQCSNGCPPDKDYKGPCEIGTTCEDHWRDWSANEARKGTT